MVLCFSLTPSSLRIWIFGYNCYRFAPVDRPRASLSLAKLPVSSPVHPFVFLPCTIFGLPTIAGTLASDNLFNLFDSASFGLNESVLDLLLQFIFVQLRIMICWLKGEPPGTFWHPSSTEQKKNCLVLLLLWWSHQCDEMAVVSSFHLVQLTEGRHARDIPKQLPSKKRNFGTSVFKVCGSCWLDLSQVKLSRMKFWKLCFQGLWWLLGLAGPTTSEILELQIVRLMVFAGPATDEILRLHLQGGICWACKWQNFRTPDCQVCGLDCLPRVPSLPDQFPNIGSLG